MNIVWFRPAPIKWVDSKEKSHFYYPDFYLPNKNIYLDPKNTFCMKQDEEKLKVVSNKLHLYFGHVNYIKDVITKLYGKQNFEYVN